MDMCKAIVIGSKGVNALGLIRSLGERQFDVTFMSTYSKIESKYTKGYLKLPDNRKKWLALLQKYGQISKEKIGMFPTDDDTAFWLDENYEALQQYFIVPHANGEMRKLADKSVMNEIAKRSGLNVPAFIKLSLSECERKNQYPIILKPYAGYAGSKGDISICHNDDEYTNAVQTLKKQGYKNEDFLILCPSKNCCDSVKQKSSSSIKYEMEYIKDLTDETKNIILTTYHSSKGLEAKVVFLTEIDKIYVSNDASDQIKRKILYVGMTRASEKLYIHSTSSENGKYLTELKKLL